MPPPATLLITTKTATPGILVLGPSIHTSWLAPVKGPMQLARAKATTLGARQGRDIQIDFFQKWVYVWIGQMLLAPLFSDSIF
jgi:hypothetical protein